MERAISHDDTARTCILKPERDGYTKRTGEIEDGGQKREKKWKKTVCVWMHVCLWVCALCMSLILKWFQWDGLSLGLFWPFSWRASRWPRFVELGLGLGFRTLLGGNGAVNTKGLVQRVASLTVSFYVCVGRGGRNLKLMDWIATKIKHLL